MEPRAPPAQQAQPQQPFPIFVGPSFPATNAPLRATRVKSGDATSLIIYSGDGFYTCRRCVDDGVLDALLAKFVCYLDCAGEEQLEDLLRNLQRTERDDTRFALHVAWFVYLRKHLIEGRSLRCAWRAVLREYPSPLLFLRQHQEFARGVPQLTALVKSGRKTKSYTTKHKRKMEKCMTDTTVYLTMLNGNAEQLPADMRAMVGPMFELAWAIHHASVNRKRPQEGGDQPRAKVWESMQAWAGCG
tara:strand:- start:4186 stop:4920 length:735 start_codon:yes stop_codon:yes gene_type:complete